MKEKLLKEIKRDYKATYGVKPDKLVEHGMWYAINYMEDKNEFAISLNTNPLYDNAKIKIINEEVVETKIKLVRGSRKS